uniref:Uncharacterized protein n=1 Tax=Rhizophora mucronata TaxID=61149 RepID=A0A2P2JZT9_RHIMU
MQRRPSEQREQHAFSLALDSYFHDNLRGPFYCKTRWPQNANKLILLGLLQYSEMINLDVLNLLLLIVTAVSCSVKPSPVDFLVSCRVLLIH